MKVVEVHRAVLVDRGGAAVLPRLPEAEDRALGVGADGHAPRVEDVERLRDHLPARVPHAPGVVVGVLHADIGRPNGRLLGRPRDRPDVPAAEAAHEVVLTRAGRHPVLGLPAEEPGVELGGRGRVGLIGVDPAGHPGRVVLARAHARQRRRACAAAQTSAMWSGPATRSRSPARRRARRGKHPEHPGSVRRHDDSPP